MDLPEICRNCGARIGAGTVLCVKCVCVKKPGPRLNRPRLMGRRIPFTPAARSAQRRQIDEIRALLYEGPATDSELGVSSGFGTQKASAYLCALKMAGEAEVIGHVGSGPNEKPAGIYRLTSRGSNRVLDEDRRRIDADRFSREEAS